ncbi:hypothetical protein HYH03_011653 [Edaphochlamys debaryana]|uniref:Pherophorin domain-containing protein n=1 Tax=Edaphochlamys debaryana TaxID=47281 RepID=A0A836BUX2_9CHLO|nr:hypothetical protein HYH03_011653 [Edaphochlamys debaryana]|eukprot:KAG2489850.1 hypothetical protein HYH03_011653 [Edaphochlamys debaryana]
MQPLSPCRLFFPYDTCYLGAACDELPIELVVLPPENWKEVASLGFCVELRAKSPPTVPGNNPCANSMVDGVTELRIKPNNTLTFASDEGPVYWVLDDKEITPLITRHYLSFNLTGRVSFKDLNSSHRLCVGAAHLDWFELAGGLCNQQGLGQSPASLNTTSTSVWSVTCTYSFYGSYAYLLPLGGFKIRRCCPPCSDVMLYSYSSNSSATGGAYSTCLKSAIDVSPAPTEPSASPSPPQPFPPAPPTTLTQATQAPAATPSSGASPPAPMASHPALPTLTRSPKLVVLGPSKWDDAPGAAFCVALRPKAQAPPTTNPCASSMTAGNLELRLKLNLPWPFTTFVVTNFTLDGRDIVPSYEPAPDPNPSFAPGYLNFDLGGVSFENGTQHVLCARNSVLKWYDLSASLCTNQVLGDSYDNGTIYYVSGVTCDYSFVNYYSMGFAFLTCCPGCQ